jgi:PPOX class probable F420-dependent enzyme
MDVLPLTCLNHADQTSRHSICHPNGLHARPGTPRSAPGPWHDDGHEAAGGAGPAAARRGPVGHKPKTTSNLKRLRNIAENPLVSVLADHYSDDWAELWWARADGRAAILTDPAEMDAPIALLTSRYPQYRAARPDGPVIAIQVNRWLAWSAS